MRRKKVWIILGSVCIAMGLLVLVGLNTPGVLKPRMLGGPVAIHKVTTNPPKHGLLGVGFQDPAKPPLTIQSVLKGSGAATAGLQPGDVIVSAGGATTPDYSAIQRVLKRLDPGDEITLNVGRGSNSMQFKVRLMSFAEIAALREQEFLEQQELNEPAREEE